MSKRKAPRRHKAEEDLNPDEYIDYSRTGELPETDEYRAARRQALEDAGLESDDPEPPDLDDMTADDHLNAIRRTR